MAAVIRPSMPFSDAFHECVRHGLYIRKDRMSALTLVPVEGVINPATIASIFPIEINTEGLGNLNTKAEQVWALGRTVEGCARLYAFRDGEQVLSRDEFQALPVNRYGVNSKDGWRMSSDVTKHTDKPKFGR